MLIWRLVVAGGATGRLLSEKRQMRYAASAMLVMATY